MRWNLQLAVLLGLSFTDVASLAQGPPADQRLRTPSADSELYPPEDAGYFDSDGVVRFQLIQGRLCLDAPRHRKGAQQCEKDGVYESITVTAQRGIPSVHYVHRTPRHEVTLSVQHAKMVRIESLMTQSSEISVIEQPIVTSPGNHQIIWRTNHRKNETLYEGATLLHLRHQDAKRFDRHFGQLLRRLLRGKSLQALSEKTELALLRHIQMIPSLDVEAVHEAIDQLASPKSAVRQSAQRFLLSCGTPVLPIVHQRGANDLDAEQFLRVQRIVEALQPLEDDTAASLASLLVNDAEHWSMVASRLSPGQVRMANRHLQDIGLETIPDVGMGSNASERVARRETLITR